MLRFGPNRKFRLIEPRLIDYFDSIIPYGLHVSSPRGFTSISLSIFMLWSSLVPQMFFVLYVISHSSFFRQLLHYFLIVSFTLQHTLSKKPLLAQPPRDSWREALFTRCFGPAVVRFEELLWVSPPKTISGK